MANKMLIDASHPEETRVVVVRGSKVEEFDFEAASRKQLRGNIYLAKVTRVEPSLQAAFVEYGGNRHGFLAFSEIHPDYYQIPVADRQALIEEYEQAERERDQEDDRRSKRKRASAKSAAPAPVVKSDESDESEQESTETDADAGYQLSDLEPPSRSGEKQGLHGIPATLEAAEPLDGEKSSTETGKEDTGENAEAVIEQVGGIGDASEDIPERPRQMRRQYKIQEVIKRRQILLVQVVKEERGNKGAALTTYLSLAGRYSVLMPNTGRGGGISRKITNAQDRKRLKEIAHDLEVPQGMGVILRTAGASRTKAEIKRDFEYLMRLWVSVRELTMNSSAPALVYEEGSLIKRAIRDLYNKDIDEVLVSGDDAYREAKDFMRMLMPSHARLVKPYKEPQPLFARYDIETQLDAMFSEQVTLKSGGYLVINPTEALVSIDVNSGRATREHNIEDTALKTNLEAAEEVARQLRLRDLAGLIVIDFIDMEEKRNNRAVEKRLNDCLKNDRARIQVGRISPFGLMEMSRQRIRTGVLESSSIPCPHCAGTGFIRSTPSVALHILRSIEENLIHHSAHDLILRTRTQAAFYILNQKRSNLQELENRFSVSISVVADDSLTGLVTFAIDRGELAVKTERKPSVTGLKAEAVSAQTVVDSNESDDDPIETYDDDQSETATSAKGDDAEGSNGDANENGEGENRRRRRRRRGRGGRRDRFHETDAQTAESSHDDHITEEEAPLPVTDVSPVEETDNERQAPVIEPVVETVVQEEPATVEAPRKRTRRTKKAAEAETVASVEPPVEEKPAASEEEAPAKPARARRTRTTKTATKKTSKTEKQAQDAPESEKPAEARPKQPKSAPAIEAPLDQPPPEEPVAVVLTPADPARPKRAGWWSKAKSVLSGGSDD